MPFDLRVDKIETQHCAWLNKQTNKNANLEPAKKQYVSEVGSTTLSFVYSHYYTESLLLYIIY